MKSLSLFIIIIILFSLNCSAIAYDFYGISISDKDAPSVFLKYGIVGFRPIVNNVTPSSPAGKYGFRQGDLIFSVNGKNIKSVAELGQFETDKLSVVVLRAHERVTFSIDRLSFLAEQRTTTKISQASNTIPKKLTHKVIDNNLPVLVFDNATLERKYGKSVPENLAGQRELSQIEQAKLEIELAHQAATKSSKPDQQTTANNIKRKYSKEALEEKAWLEERLNDVVSKSSIALNMGLREKERLVESIKSDLVELERDPVSYMQERNAQRVRAAQAAENNRRFMQQVAAEKAAAEQAANQAAVGPIQRLNNGNAINTGSGEVLQRNSNGSFWGTRSGTLYTPTGSNGITNTRTGEFLPIH